MAWEEFHKSRQDQLVIYRQGDEYELWWENWGHGPNVRRPVPPEAVESFLRGEHTGDDLIGYAMDGGWPQKMTAEEVEEADRAFLRRNPRFLLVNPENQRHFSAAELEELMPKARKAQEASDQEPYDPWEDDGLGEE